MREIVFSMDIETNGDIPGVSSMLSLGCVAVDPEDYHVVGTFSVNLERLPNDYQTQGNKAFWDKFPEQYEATRKNTVRPVVAMLRFRDWARDICARFSWYDDKKQATVPARAAALAYPGSWDFGTFVYWYLNFFLGEDSSPFRHHAKDIRTMISMVMDLPYCESHINKVPKEWLPAERLSRVEKAEKMDDKSFSAEHDALKDAEEQAVIYIALEKRWKQMRNAADLWERFGSPPAVRRMLAHPAALKFESCGRP